jgi:hypothetical protein
VFVCGVIVYLCIMGLLCSDCGVLCTTHLLTHLHPPEIGHGSFVRGLETEATYGISTAVLYCVFCVFCVCVCNLAASRGPSQPCTINLFTIYNNLFTIYPAASQSLVRPLTATTY